MCVKKTINMYYSTIISNESRFAVVADCQWLSQSRCALTFVGFRMTSSCILAGYYAD